MKETTELSPAVENRRGINKDSDVSKNVIDGFELVPIDAKLMAGIRRFLKAKKDLDGEDYNLIQHIHYDLLDCLGARLEEMIGSDVRERYDFEKWYPELSIFENVPEIDQYWNPKSKMVEDLPKE
jgi:hypothetical protein